MGSTLLHCSQPHARREASNELMALLHPLCFSSKHSSHKTADEPDINTDLPMQIQSHQSSGATTPFAQRSSAGVKLVQWGSDALLLGSPHHGDPTFLQHLHLVFQVPGDSHPVWQNLETERRASPMMISSQSLLAAWCCMAACQQSESHHMPQCSKLCLAHLAPCNLSNVHQSTWHLQWSLLLKQD